MVWTVTVEVAFTTAPMSTSPSWTDITAYVLEGSIQITRGRPDEFGEVAPSTLALTLKNFDGRFTMFYSGGANYPNVKIGKRIRVSVVRSAVTYRRFDGHVNNWPTQWPTGRAAHALAPITATDRLKRFGRPGNLRSMLEEEILRDAPVASYPLGEPQGAMSAASVAPGAQAPLLVRQQGSGGLVEFGAGTGPGTDELSAPIWTPATTAAGQYLEAALTAPVSGGTGRWLEVWWATSNTAIVSRVLAVLSDGSGNSMMLNLNEFGELEGSGSRAGGTETFAVAWVTGANDMRIHHAVLTESISGSTVTVRLYGDGAERASTTFTSTGLPVGRYLSVGWWKSNPSGYGIWNGTLAHAAAGAAALSATRVAAHYSAGNNGFSGERTDQRIGRIADWVGIPAADRAFDAGDSTVGQQATSGRQPIEAMREVEATESGVLFSSGAGLLTFHSRSRRYNVSPAVTLAAAQLAAPLSFPADDAFVTNDMTVTRAAGSQARAVNQTSIDDYGLYRDETAVVSETDAAALSAAQWRVNNYGDPRTRVPDLAVEVGKLEAKASASVAAVLASDIGTKWRVTGLPATAPASQADVFVEGLAETIGKRVWQIVFNTSPGDVSSPVWQLGVAGFSELGDTTRLGA